MVSTTGIGDAGVPPALLQPFFVWQAPCSYMAPGWPPLVLDQMCLWRLLPRPGACLALQAASCSCPAWAATALCLVQAKQFPPHRRRLFICMYPSGQTCSLCMDVVGLNWGVHLCFGPLVLHLSLCCWKGWGVAGPLRQAAAEQQVLAVCAAGKPWESADCKLWCCSPGQPVLSLGHQGSQQQQAVVLQPAPAACAAGRL